MRVLRSSCFVDPSHPPLTIVVRDGDIVDTLESAAIQSQTPGTFVVHDIFELRNASIQEATHKAMKRIDETREEHMALLYFWTLAHFRRITREGTIYMDKPAPLTVDDIKYVFDQLKREPEYDNFHITTFAHDGTRVRLVKGEIR